jgi:hypothetical protein
MLNRRAVQSFLREFAFTPLASDLFSLISRRSTRLADKSSRLAAQLPELASV